jgi:hypothetical protein
MTSSVDGTTRQAALCRIRAARSAGVAQVTPRPARRLPLLFALNFAVGLPPGALARRSATAPVSGLTWPRVHSSQRAVASPDAVAAILGRPLSPVGRGVVLLGEVDCRLRGLAVVLDVMRVVGATGSLITLSTVEPAGAASDDATVADLWTLARRALTDDRVRWRPLGALGQEAFLAIHDQTVQVAWLAGDRLATASMTDLHADLDDLVRLTQWIAQFVDWTLANDRG